MDTHVHGYPSTAIDGRNFNGANDDDDDADDNRNDSIAVIQPSEVGRIRFYSTDDNSRTTSATRLAFPPSPMSQWSPTAM